MCGKNGMKLRGQVDAAAVAQVDIHQRQVNFAGFCMLQCFLRVAGFGRNPEVGHRFQPCAQAVAHQRMVIDQKNIDKWC